LRRWLQSWLRESAAVDWDCSRVRRWQGGICGSITGKAAVVAR